MSTQPLVLNIPKPEVEWKSPWRLDLEKYLNEQALKRPVLTAAQIQARKDRIAVVKTIGTVPKRVRKPEVSRYQPRQPKKFCTGCNKGLRESSILGKCQKCLRLREKCGCGKTIYLGISGDKCKECWHKANQAKCPICQTPLNRTNVYGICKYHYQIYRRYIHQVPSEKCTFEDCVRMIRPTNRHKMCRAHSRHFYAKKSKDKAKANPRPKNAPKDCVCGHSKQGHYNNLGMCRQENETDHICSCRRYKPLSKNR